VSEKKKKKTEGGSSLACGQKRGDEKYTLNECGIVGFVLLKSWVHQRMKS